MAQLFFCTCKFTDDTLIRPSIIIHMKILFNILILALIIQGCSEENRDKKIMAEFDKFQSELKTTLQGAIKKEGFGGAIEVCRQASPVAEKDFSTGGMVIRRVSEKPRNPDHKPDNFEMTVLKIWQQKLAKGEKPAVFTSETDEGYRVMKPIYIQAPCLQCHGEKLNPEAAKRIAELYPDDKATGYKEGDLRGAFSAILK